MARECDAELNQGDDSLRPEWVRQDSRTVADSAIHTGHLGEIKDNTDETSSRLAHKLAIHGVRRSNMAGDKRSTEWSEDHIDHGQCVQPVVRSSCQNTSTGSNNRDGCCCRRRCKSRSQRRRLSPDYDTGNKKRRTRSIRGKEQDNILNGCTDGLSASSLLTQDDSEV